MPATAATSASPTDFPGWRSCDHTSPIAAGISAHDTQVTILSIEVRSSLLAREKRRASSAARFRLATSVARDWELTGTAPAMACTMVAPVAAQ